MIYHQHLIDIISWSLMGFKQAVMNLPVLHWSALANQLAKIQSQPIKLK
jgi:hypothetical protein